MAHPVEEVRRWIQWLLVARGERFPFKARQDFEEDGWNVRVLQLFIFYYHNFVFFFLFSKLVVPKSDHFSGGGPISVRYIRMKIVRAQQNASSSRERILVPDDN